MATLRLTFPEKEEPTVIALTGARLTIGRLPFNTIQIIDRTVSGFHAELISEHGHYRLHDRGSSNGTFVNGQKIADYHLTEGCTITFGTVEAQFSPEEVSAVEDAESFPTRSEINAVRKDNAELKATVEALREETAALRLARPVGQTESALAVSQGEFEAVVGEREGLKERQIKLEEEINRLKTDLAVLKRDRVNLQLAYDGVQRELSELRAKSAGVPEVALQPKDAAAALSGSASSNEEIRVEVPSAKAETASAQPKPAPASPAPAPATSPMRPFAPLPKTPAAAFAAPVEKKGTERLSGQPAAAAPKTASAAPAPAKQPAPPVSPVKPFSPLPKAPAVAGTAQPVAAAPATSVAGVPSAGPMKAPSGLGGGPRPLARPIVASTPASDAVANAPTAKLSPTPQPPVKLPAQPTVKLPPAKPAAAGPKGTQKL